MSKGRLEAFSDGVFAIIITIMVLELHAPEGNTFEALKPLLPKFISYILSFIYVAIYWNNHHHMFQIVQKVNGKILWCNILLLFCLSLVPFVTAWMGENYFSATPVALYGIVLLMSAAAYSFLVRSLLALHGSESLFSASIGSDFKGKVSIFFYVTGLLISFFYPEISLALYFIVACIWFIPDRRFEKKMNER